MVKVRQLAVDEHYSLRGQTLDDCIQRDKRNGLIPFFVRIKFLLYFTTFLLLLGLWDIRYNIMLFI
jgi:hypothetical protein